jgi:Transposase, Mutator family
MDRISKSQVSRLCAEIGMRVSAFLGRPIEGDWPYLWIVNVRETGLIVSVAAIVAVGVNTDGRREVLGRPGAGLPQSVAGTRCAGSHVPASARPARRRTSSQLRAPSVAQRRSRSSRKRSVSEPLSRRSSSAIAGRVGVADRAQGRLPARAPARSLMTLAPWVRGDPARAAREPR